MTSGKRLVVLSCSATKRDDTGLLPALERYNGPMYQVLRTFLREAAWPSSLSVAVMSAEHGLIGGLAQIEDYDRRMTRDLSDKWRPGSTKTLQAWGQQHDSVTLVLGKDYLPALDRDLLDQRGIKTEVVRGGIGTKLGGLRSLLRGMEHQTRPAKPNVSPGRPLYFLPDWDDMLDKHFNFAADRFSNPRKADREEVHCTTLMDGQRMSDGILVSLAQHIGKSSKGVLKKFAEDHDRNLAPEPMRERFGLAEDQWVFGDCGAFSYVDEPEPTITPERALAMYQLYGFDLGASVDHIPLPVFSPEERDRRLGITRRNAERFIELHKERRCSFVPVGVIQGTDPESYALELRAYKEMGYAHVGIGGLVPRSDKEILAVMRALNQELNAMRKPPWMHLFGVYRPKIHRQLYELGATSFDSATYFRKAWLRSDQNYLKADGSWHAAIRIPMTSDPRTRKRLQASNLPLDELADLEREALDALHEYGRKRKSLESTLEAIAAYDFLLTRSEDHGANLIPAYERTLADRPWEKCGCAICEAIGVDVVIFRGSNRNKRRGAHNTAILYGSVVRGSQA
jgi:hypothetical protein